MTTPAEQSTAPASTATPLTPDLAALLADGRPFVRCGCGFVAISVSVVSNNEALEEHPCPHRADSDDKEPGGTRWYEHVFSFWGAVILFLIASAVLVALGRATW
jgi:hypothetical protein